MISNETPWLIQSRVNKMSKSRKPIQSGILILTKANKKPTITILKLKLLSGISLQILMVKIKTQMQKQTQTLCSS